MRRLLLLLAVLGAGALHAQDKIQTRTGEIFSGKILQMDAFQLRLLRVSGSDTTISLTDLHYVIHQTGFRDRIGHNGSIHRRFAPGFEFQKLREIKYRSNYFHIGIGNMFAGELSMGYERLFDNGKIGLKLPLKFNVFPLQYGYYDTDMELLDSYGLDINFYPGRQGTFRFFAGMGFRTGSYVLGYNEREASTQNRVFANGYGNNYHEYEANFRAVMLNTGVFFRPLTWLGVNAVVGLGAARISAVSDEEAPEEYRKPQRTFLPDLQLNLTIGL